MNCKHCGSEINEVEKFCGRCGKEINQNGDKVMGLVAENMSKTKKYITGAISLVVFIVVFSVVRYATQEGFGFIMDSNKPTKQELINQAVTEVKNSTSLPMRIDEFTVWTGIAGTEDAIRYQYTLQDIDIEQVSNTILKNIVAPSLCSNSDTRIILDENINMEYSYSVENSTLNFFFVVSKSDCL